MGHKEAIPVTHLQKFMLEELQRRHYSEATTQRYIRLVERFAQQFHCSPDRLGPRHIREYQDQLFTVQKLSPGSVTNHLCALRFFCIQTLKRPWSIADTPYPKKRHRLPTILSQEEVAQLIDAACTPFSSNYPHDPLCTGVRDAELNRLKVSDIHSRRIVIQIQGGKGRSAPIRPAPDLITTSRPLSHRFPPSMLLPTLSTTSTLASVSTPDDSTPLPHSIQFA
jgi:integrase/recombinase XerD